MISLKIREKETEKTVRRAIKICQDKEKSRKSIQSLLIYNGDGKTFDTFMESMINDYLNSDSMSKCSDSDFIEKVELVDKTA